MEKGKPFYNMTPEELAEAGRLGGIKSGEAKRRKKAMKESLELLLSMPIKGGKQADIEKIKDFASLKGKNISVEQAMIIAQIQKALRGDSQAFTVLRDTSGQKPDDNLNITGSVPVVIKDDLDNDD